MTRQMTGAKMVVQALKDQGVEVVFGYPGGAVLPIYDEIFQQNDIRHILVRHEQGAAHAAEGYARSTGKPGVVLVTSGPGAIRGDEMKKIFGDDFVDGLEIANMAWGLANLPAAVATIPKGLAKLRISATKTLESGTDAFRSFVKNAKNLDNVKVDFDLTKIAAAFKALKETDRVAYIKTLRNKIADIAIKYDNLVESGVPSDKVKKIYSSLRRMLFSVSSNGEILLKVNAEKEGVV